MFSSNDSMFPVTKSQKLSPRGIRVFSKNGSPFGFVFRPSFGKFLIHSEGKVDPNRGTTTTQNIPRKMVAVYRVLTNPRNELPVAPNLGTTPISPNMLHVWKNYIYIYILTHLVSNSPPNNGKNTFGVIWVVAMTVGHHVSQEKTHFILPHSHSGAISSFLQPRIGFHPFITQPQPRAYDSQMKQQKLLPAWRTSLSCRMLSILA